MENEEQKDEFTPTHNNFNGLGSLPVVSWLPQRLQVILPGLLLLCLITAAVTILVAMKTRVFGSETMIFAGNLLAGPFAALGNPLNDPSTTIVIGIVLITGILVHPIRPGVVTGLVSVMAFLIWLLSGLMVACIGV